MDLSCCGYNSVFFFPFYFLIFSIFDILQIKLGLHLKKLFQKLWPILMLPWHFKIQEFKQPSWMYALIAALSLLFFPSFRFFISFWTVSFEVLQLFFHYIVFYNIWLFLQCSQNPLSIAKYQNDKEVSLKFYPTCLIVIIVMLVLHVHIQIIYAIKAIFLLIY